MFHRQAMARPYAGRFLGFLYRLRFPTYQLLQPIVCLIAQEFGSDSPFELLVKEARPPRWGPDESMLVSHGSLNYPNRTAQMECDMLILNG